MEIKRIRLDKKSKTMVQKHYWENNLEVFFIENLGNFFTTVGKGSHLLLNKQLKDLSGLKEKINFLPRLSKGLDGKKRRKKTLNTLFENKK